MDPEWFSGLPPEFFWLDRFQVPPRVLWPEAHADEVLAKYREGNVSKAQLARDFGKSVPTIRKAIGSPSHEHAAKANRTLIRWIVCMAASLPSGRRPFR